MAERLDRAARERLMSVDMAILVGAYRELAGERLRAELPSLRGLLVHAVEQGRDPIHVRLRTILSVCHTLAERARRRADEGRLSGASMLRVRLALAQAECWAQIEARVLERFSRYARARLEFGAPAWTVARAPLRIVPEPGWEMPAPTTDRVWDACEALSPEAFAAVRPQPPVTEHGHACPEKLAERAPMPCRHGETICPTCDPCTCALPRSTRDFWTTTERFKAQKKARKS